VTVIDSLDTMYIMGLREEFDRGLRFVEKADFSQPAVRPIPPAIINTSPLFNPLTCNHSDSRGLCPILRDSYPLSRRSSVSLRTVSRTHPPITCRRLRPPPSPRIQYRKWVSFFWRLHLHVSLRPHVFAGLNLFVLFYFGGCHEIKRYTTWWYTWYTC
jgi:hypothetical protein